jgi:hypothetical protein
MTILDISIEDRYSVLLRLLQSGENFIDACSKSGLNAKIATKFLKAD